MKLFFVVSSFIIFISGFTSLYSLLPGKATTPNLPALKTSWSVAVDSLKQSPLLGVGPANFVSGYSKYRPVIANSTTNWGIKYLVASNTYLTILSEIGIIGFVLFVSLFILSLNKFNVDKLNELSSYKIGILIAFIIAFVYPYSPSFLPILFILFALNSESREVGGVFNSKIPLVLISLPFLGLIGLTSYGAYKAFYSEFLFGNTLKLVSQNEALKAYESIGKTVNSNPYVDRYHMASSEINMAIAQSLSKKEDITDEDKKTLSELIQQSIRESKAVVSLSPHKSTSWESLGDIYINISPFAQDANKFAIQSFNQAIFLDPINPALRIKLGGIYYADGKFEEAIKVFELAVLAKPDFANSHFNLAMAYKGDEQIEKAKEQMEIVLKLVDPNSNDYQIAKAELDTLNTNSEKVDTSSVSSDQAESLTPPASPAPSLEPQIEIPQEEQPIVQ